MVNTDFNPELIFPILETHFSKIIVSNVKEEKKVPITVKEKPTVSLREGIKETAKKLVIKQKLML